MRKSYARQLDLPGMSTADTGTFQSSAPQLLQSDLSNAGTLSSFSPLSGPSADAYGSAYSATSRLLARLNTTTVTKQEVDDLLHERRVILRKKLNGTITPQDENRLQYVRWSLDRIQDAKNGPALDALETLVENYSRFVHDMGTFADQLNLASRPQPTSRPEPRRRKGRH